MTRSGRERYLLYLPENGNDLWRYIWEKGIKINIYIEVPEEAPSRE